MVEMPASPVAFPKDRERGRWIRHRRQALGLDQEQAADRLGWSSATLSRVETGRRGIYPRDVDSLARLLRVPSDWFEDPGPADLTDEPSRQDGTTLRDLREILERQEQAITEMKMLLLTALTRGRQSEVGEADERDPLRELLEPPAPDRRRRSASD